MKIDVSCQQKIANIFLRDLKTLSLYMESTIIRHLSKYIISRSFHKNGTVFGDFTFFFSGVLRKTSDFISRVCWAPLDVSSNRPLGCPGVIFRSRNGAPWNDGSYPIPRLRRGTVVPVVVKSRVLGPWCTCSSKLVSQFSRSKCTSQPVTHVQELDANRNVLIP